MSVQVFNDDKTQKKLVQMSYDEYLAMRRIVEESEDIRDFDQRMASLNTDDFDDVKDQLCAQD